MEGNDLWEEPVFVVVEEELLLLPLLLFCCCRRAAAAASSLTSLPSVSFPLKLSKIINYKNYPRKSGKSESQIFLERRFLARKFK